MTSVRFLSVCSGIEAASVAWHPLGWHAHAFSEIEAFPSAVLAHHHPGVPNLGDMTRHKEWPDATVDVLVGGTPCQSFSVAGLRKGMADPRGNLALVFLAIADRFRPEWIVWENVPGVLSSNEGRDFGAFVGGLGELGYGFAYRILDAQFFGVPQRRRRVFVVGCAGGWQRAAAVLFERHSLSGNPSPRRQARQVAPTLPSRRSAGGGMGTDFDCDGDLVAAPHADISPALKARDGKGPSSDGDGDGDGDGAILVPMIAHSLRGEGFDASEDGTGRGTPLVASTVAANSGRMQIEATYLPVAFAQNQRDEVRTMDVAGALAAEPGMKQQTYVATTAVRRLTPRECERLQGFPDDYTLIPFRGKPAADGNRYKALGNSMAVPVMRWIGERIAAVDLALRCRVAETA